MQVQTLRSVPFTDVLDRLPDEVDRAELVYFFSEWTEYAYGTNSHTLVPWCVLADEISDCCIELGYGAPDINEIFPTHIPDAQMTTGPRLFTSHIFVDLEN